MYCCSSRWMPKDIPKCTLELAVRVIIFHVRQPVRIAAKGMTTWLLIADVPWRTFTIWRGRCFAHIGCASECRVVFLSFLMASFIYLNSSCKKLRDATKRVISVASTPKHNQMFTLSSIHFIHPCRKLYTQNKTFSVSQVHHQPPSNSCINVLPFDHL